MDNSRSSLIAYYIILSLLVLFSFLNFSERFFPLLNSDQAVTILMTPGFTIPGDLYFWGQDRAGSLLPMLANLLVAIYRFPPVLAVSVVHYAVLILGFLALATLIRNRSLKLLLAVIWFFPSWHFLDHVTLLFGVQLSVFAVGIYFLKLAENEKRTWFHLLWLSAACLAFIASVWVSDLALPSVLLLLVPFLLKYWTILVKKNGITALIKDRRLLLSMVTLVFWLAVGVFAILFAKHRATRIDAYNEHILNNPYEMWISLKMIFYTIYKVLIFSSENFMESIYAWAILSGVPVILAISKYPKPFSEFCRQHKWMVFFALNGILLLLVLVLSHWVLLNGVNRRYFTIVYISFWVFFLLYIDATGIRSNVPQRRGSRIRTILLSVIIVAGAVSSFDKFYFPKRIPPRIDVLGDLKKLGDIGIIAEYWNAYLTAAVDPDHIKATPHDRDLNRSAYLTEQVFRQPRIYLIRDQWLESFPDSIVQYGHILRKEGEEFRMGNCYLCRYFPELLHMEFTWKEMQHQGIVEEDTMAVGKQSVKTGPGMDRARHFVFGPFVKLAPGKITVTFRIRSSDCLSTDNLAYLDVAAEYGSKTLGSKTIRASDFEQAKKYQDFDIPVELDAEYKGVEFRILYLGKADLWFDKVTIKGRL